MAVPSLILIDSPEAEVLEASYHKKRVLNIKRMASRANIFQILSLESEYPRMGKRIYSKISNVHPLSFFFFKKQYDERKFPPVTLKHSLSSIKFLYT